jgi:hypothetical protein
MSGTKKREFIHKSALSPNDFRNTLPKADTQTKKAIVAKPVLPWVTQRQTQIPSIQGPLETGRTLALPALQFYFRFDGNKCLESSGARWTLRRYLLDLINGTVQNSHRQDITKLSANVRGPQLVELLPPGERRILRCNGHPYLLVGGIGGRAGLAGNQ